MRRTTIRLNDRQTASLDRLAADEGVSRAEIIRRLLDRVLVGADDALASDLMAIDASFGSLADRDLDNTAIERGDGGRERHLSNVWQLTAEAADE